MFLEIDQKPPDSMALIDGNGQKMTYGELCRFTAGFYHAIGERTLAFILCDNSAAAACGYLAALSSRVVPLLLSKNLDSDALENFIGTYKPAYIWAPATDAMLPGEAVWHYAHYTLLKTGLTPYPMYDELSLLLPTSGSTGSPKLVRHSYENVEANARNVAAFFGLDASERPLLDAPIHYTYGLSILSSHLYAGAAVLLTAATVLSGEYWRMLKEYEATSISGVPFTYEMLRKMRFFKMQLPFLRTITQGGGKLADDLFMQCARYAKETNRRFIPTYGQSESTARMTGLPPEEAMARCGSIGKAMPGGKLALVDEEGRVVTQPGQPGEIVFEGRNVTLGYAQCGEDLLKGDERHGILHTGDMAVMDAEGFLFITGRKSRFLKLYGTRVGLDACEQLVKDKFNTECACAGKDDKMKVFVLSKEIMEDVRQYLSVKTGIHPTAFEVCAVDAFPRNDAGKMMYAMLE